MKIYAKCETRDGPLYWNVLTEHDTLGPNTEEFKKDVLDLRYKTYYKILDDNNIDKVVSFFYEWTKNQAWYDSSNTLYICRMKDNSYSIIKDFRNTNKITFVSKNNSKRKMIKLGYIKRNSYLRKEEKLIKQAYRSR
jgi:hypothetical protein